MERSFERGLERPLGIVLAGTAGERIQTAATILARAALACGLHVTQKNDNPVTQGTGFSVSEVILAPEPILYTGIERPDAVLVTSADGARELAASGMLARADAESLVVADEQVELPSLPAGLLRLPFRETAGPKLAALAAVAAWRDATEAIPMEALRAAAVARIGEEDWTKATRDAEQLRAGAVSVIDEERVEDGVDPFAVLEVRLALGSLPDVAGALGVSAGGFVEGIDLELEPVVAELLEQERLQEPGRLVADPPAAEARERGEPLEPRDATPVVHDVEADGADRLPVGLDHEAAEPTARRASARSPQAPPRGLDAVRGPRNGRTASSPTTSSRNSVSGGSARLSSTATQRG